MLSHAAIPGFNGGYVGVDVFFVISGFLITGILIREAITSGRVSIPAFYARRARRILPAGTVVLVTIVAASTLVLTTARLHQVLTHVTWAAFFGANIYSARSGSDYFAQSDVFVSPVLHFWSLAVEEQFYLVWPALIALIMFAGRRRQSSAPLAEWRQPAVRLRRLRVTIAVLCALSLAFSIWQTRTSPTSAYYSTLTRGWELGAGALLALCEAYVTRWTPAVKLVASWLGLAAIIASMLWYSSTTPFPGYFAALPVVGAVLVLAGGIEGPRAGARVVLDTRLMRWFGDISYSLYLWHWPLLLLPELYLAHTLSLRARIIMMATATIAAWLSYLLIETPALRSGLLSRTRTRALVLWPTAISLVLAAVLVAPFIVSSMSSFSGVSTYDRDPGSSDYSPVQAIIAASAQARSKDPLPELLHPALEKLSGDVSELPKGCGTERDDTSVGHCVLGDPNGKQTIVVFGDSHSIMWMQPLDRLAKADGYRIIPFEKASCFPLDATEWRTDVNRTYTECDTWRTAALREIAQLKPDRIITSGLLPQVFVDPASGQAADHDATMAVFASGISSTLATLHAITPHVYVIGATPFLARSAGDCLGTRAATMATCVRPLSSSIKQFNQIWKSAATANGAAFIDPIPWMCAANRCPLVVGHVIVYRDSNHVTRTFADTVSAQLAPMLDL